MADCANCWKENCLDCELVEADQPDGLKRRMSIDGIPPCPVCGELLVMQNPTVNGAGWGCTRHSGCGTQWKVGDLLDALNGIVREE